MAINAATAVTDSSAAAAAMKKATGMNKDDFLTLFITQMKHQDPLNPMDSTEFIGQLAQLTQVEQAYNTNTNLESLIAAQNGSNSLSAVSFLGTTIQAYGDQVGLSSGGQPAVSFNLPSAAKEVLVEISDSSGRVIRTIENGAMSQGNNSITWDGVSESGQALVPGLYTVKVTATDTSGKQFNGIPFIQGKVEGVSLEGNEPLLSVGGIFIPMSDVINVKGA